MGLFCSGAAVAGPTGARGGWGLGGLLARCCAASGLRRERDGLDLSPRLRKRAALSSGDRPLVFLALRAFADVGRGGGNDLCRTASITSSHGEPRRDETRQEGGAKRGSNTRWVYSLLATTIHVCARARPLKARAQGGPKLDGKDEGNLGGKCRLLPPLSVEVEHGPRLRVVDDALADVAGGLQGPHAPSISP